LNDSSLSNGSIETSVGFFVKPNSGSIALSDIEVELRIVICGRLRMQRVSYLGKNDSVYELNFYMNSKVVVERHINVMTHISNSLRFMMKM